MANLCDRIGDVNRGKSRAVVECRVANLCDRIGDVNRGKSRAVIESAFTNIGNRIGNYYIPAVTVIT